MASAAETAFDEEEEARRLAEAEATAAANSVIGSAGSAGTDSGMTGAGTQSWGAGAYQEPEGTGNEWGSTSETAITGSKGEGNVGDETYLEPHIRGLIQENRGLGQAELAGAEWGAATSNLEGTPQAGDLGFFDPTAVTGGGAFGGAKIDPIATQGPAQVGQADSWGGADIDPLDPMKVQQVGDLDAFGGARIGTDIQNQARAGQNIAMKSMANLAQGGQSQALNFQREQGLREQLAMMASQRGIPTAAVLRAGTQMQEGRDRAMGQAAAQQELAAQQGLGQVSGAMREQDIGLAGQQAQLRQQAGLAGSEQAQQRLLTGAGFGQQSIMTQAGLEAQRAQAQAGLQQQAGILSQEQRQQVEAQNAQLRQESGMARMNAYNQRAAQQAQLTQGAGLATADRDTQEAMQNASFVQQAEEANFQASQQRDMKMAEFQQQANMSNAEMEQARQVAEAQVNAQLEQTRGQLVSSLVGQGVDRYKAELQADTEVQMQYNDLLYKYFAVRQGAVVELGKEIMDQGWFFEDSTDVLMSKLSNMRLLTGMAAPYGGGGSYDVAAGIGTYPWSNASSDWGRWDTRTSSGTTSSAEETGPRGGEEDYYG